MSIACRHIAANVNPKSNALAFLNSQTLAFAFSNQIAIYNIQSNKIQLTLHDNEHNHNRANCISTFIQQQKQVLLVGFDSGFLVGFQFTNNTWTKMFSIKDNSAIISITTIKHQNIQHIFTNNNSSTIKYYTFSESNLKLKEQFSFSLNKIIESIALCIEQELLMVFMGGVDQKIHYYQRNLKEQGLLQYTFSLVGHENAITKLQIIKTSNALGDILLASASKDGYIRIWKITNDVESIKFHKNVYSILSRSKVYLEAVLMSHDCSVTSLYWVKFGDVLQLASSSLDCTVCIWGNVGNTDGAWTIQNRMGQFLGNKNAYFDVLSDPNYEYLAALNYTGALILWRWKQDKFILQECFNGHSNDVKGIQWNSTGDFLVSVSKDQTTRVIAKNCKTNQYNEISRAQIHGYDINAVTTLKAKNNTLDLIACGADEKVIRIIEPPACFANYLNTFTQANLHLYFNSEEEENKYKVSKPEDKVLLYQAYSEGGSQVLGLMTKMQRVQKEKISSYYQEEEGEDAEQSLTVDVKSIRLDYSIPPHEDYLVKHTLWPEMNKLYGHPHQIQYIARSRTSKRMASSCAALNKASASIIVWNTEEWKPAKILSFHSYTVYGIQFSYNDKYLGSVSKDRKLAVYSGETLQLLYSYEAHLRSITCLSFSRSQQYILTGSRDKTIKLHSTIQKACIAELPLKNPISAISFCHQNGRQSYFSVGCVNGELLLGKVEGKILKIIEKVDDKFTHTQIINAIKWNENTFATCSKDFSVRIFQLCL